MYVNLVNVATFDKERTSYSIGVGNEPIRGQKPYDFVVCLLNEGLKHIGEQHEARYNSRSQYLVIVQPSSPRILRHLGGFEGLGFNDAVQ